MPDDIPSFTGAALVLRPKIEHALLKACEFPGDDGKTIVAEALQYSLLLPGKRLRPLLVLLACQACGQKAEQATAAACALEMAHVFSLIHDDLPAMDDDDLRRGKPTNHKIYGEGQAILAGDGLLALAFQILAGIESPLIANRCCSSLASAIGVCGVIGGQSDDLKGLDKQADIAMLNRIHERKTAALLLCSSEIGGLIAEASEEQLLALRSYGRHLGLAFQITDDLLDSIGEEGKTGKRVRKDAAKGTKTYPAILGVEKSEKAAEDAVSRALAALAVFGASAGPLRGLAQYVLVRDR